MLRRYLDALTAGDLAAIADSFAENATWSIHGTLPLSGTKRGRGAIMELLSTSTEARSRDWPNAHEHLDELLRALLSRPRERQ